MIDIVVVTHDARRALASCVQSVRRHTRAVPHRLIIVDNASRDGTASWLRGADVEAVRHRRNLGFSGAVNAVRGRLRSDWVVLLDDDARATAGWLEGMLRAAEGDRKAVIVGCKVARPDGTINAAEMGSPWSRNAGEEERDLGQRDYTRRCESVIGACWLMRRSLFSRVGPFDERFFPCQFEDLDYCLRARLKGLAVLYHGGSAVIHDHLRRNPDSGAARLKFFEKWGSRLARFPLPDSHPWDRAEWLAARHAAAGRFDLAIRRYAEAVKGHPAPAQFYAAMAGLCLKSGDGPRAREWLSRAAAHPYFASPALRGVLALTGAP